MSADGRVKYSVEGCINVSASACKPPKHNFTWLRDPCAHATPIRSMFRNPYDRDEAGLGVHSRIGVTGYGT